MTPEQRFDIVLYRLNSAKSLLDDLSSTYKCNFLGADNKQ